MMPTGAGKTTIFDVLIPRAIVEDPGSILLTQQTEREAQDYWAERIDPTMLNVPSIRRMIEALPRGKVKKGTVVFPHMTFYCVPLNETQTQRKSVRWIFVDEAWMAKHGLLGEIRARGHDRWNMRVVIVTQGGVTHVMNQNQFVPSELQVAWTRTDRRRYSMRCPDCGAIAAWGNRSLLYEDDPDSTLESLDENAILQSARYRCAGTRSNGKPSCGVEFPDESEVRRTLSRGSIYVPSNPNPLARHIGFHTTAHALYYIPWGQLALEWKKASLSAKLGDNESRKIYIQKRLAQNWREETEAPEIILKASEYSLADFQAGELWDGEMYRVATIDRQRGAKDDIPHFWMRIRAYQNDGSSRGLFFGRLDSVEKVREKQLAFLVKDKLTFQDAQYDSGAVYDDCAKYGWIAVHGTRYASFEHHKPGQLPTHHLYSPLKLVDAPTVAGKARYVLLATDKLKDQLSALIAGRGPAFEHAADEIADYEVQMRGEKKDSVFDRVTKRETLRWVKLNSRAQNHAWDCEVTQVAVALMLKVLKGSESLSPIDTPSLE